MRRIAVYRHTSSRCTRRRAPRAALSRLGAALAPFALLAATACEAEEGGDGADSAGGGANAGGSCALTGELACLTPWLESQTCFQPSGACTREQTGADDSLSTFANGAWLKVEGDESTAGMGESTCYTATVTLKLEGGKLVPDGDSTHRLPTGETWTTTYTDAGKADTIQCPDGTTVPLQSLAAVIADPDWGQRCFAPVLAATQALGTCE